MTFRLPRLPAHPVNHPTLQHYWERLVKQIEAQEAVQDAILSRIRRVNSHTSPTSIFTATENGATATIVVANHTRVYADATTVSITGNGPGGRTGLTCDTVYGVYYDDTTLAVTAPTFVFTTTVADAQAAKAEGRHFCGVIRTPPAGSGQTRTGGGVYAMGSSIGGEV